MLCNLASTALEVELLFSPWQSYNGKSFEQLRSVVVDCCYWSKRKTRTVPLLTRLEVEAQWIGKFRPMSLLFEKGVRRILSR